MSRQTLDPTRIPLYGTQLIEASAGTGKTYTITSLLVRLVTEAGLGIEQVLAVTFTNAAAAELEERIRERLLGVQAAFRAGEAGKDEVARHLLARPDRDEIERRLDRAARDVDRAAVTTIHGFCARALSEYALSTLTRPDTTLLGDDRGILYDAVTDFWSTHVATLTMAEFRALGGGDLHAGLAKVARGVVSAPGVPLEASSGEALAFDAALDGYLADFVHTRGAFLEQGRGLFELLLAAPGLKRNSYSTGLIEREFRNLVRYFQATEPNVLSHPDLKEGYFTATRVAQFTKKGHQPLSHPLLDLLERHRDGCQEVLALASRKRESLLRKLAMEIEARLEQEHARLGTQSFDGLLRALAKSLTDGVTGKSLARAIRGRFPALLIDEFQDTDPVQYGIFRQIYAADQHSDDQPDSSERGSTPHTTLFLIGDPKQSIYRFRGADVSTYLEAARLVEGDVWTLGTNWRSGPSVVAAQNALFGEHPSPLGSPAIRYEAVRAAPDRADLLLSAEGRPLPGLRLLRAQGQDVIGLAAAEVARLLASGCLLEGKPLSPRHIAVLTRTNAEAEKVQAALRRLGVPAVMHGDRSVFESKEAKELRRILRALLEPGRRPLLHAALATRLIGRTADDLARLETDGDAFEREMEGVRRYATAWRTRGIAVALETLFSDVDFLARTLADIDGERRVTNLRHLLELLHQAEVERHLGMVGLLRFLETAIAAPTGHEMAAEARQVRLESDDDAVTLTTMHKSKGLEYGVVLLPQLGRAEPNFQSPTARYHDPARQGREFLYIGSHEVARELDRPEAQEEVLRLGYVGLTRAQHHVIAFVEQDKVFSALTWLLHGGTLGPLGTPAQGEDFKQLSEAVIDANYAALERRAAGAIAIEDAPPADLDVPRYRRVGGLATALIPPPETKPPLTQRRTSSFSAMTRAKAALSRAEREGKDVDRAPAAPGALEAPAAAALDAIALEQFPRGAGPGDALHAILERLPFAGGTDPARQSILESELGRRGFDAAHAPVLQRCLGAALEVPLTPSGVRLLDLEPKDCARELEFSLPVRQRGKHAAGEATHLLSATAIEQCLSKHASERLGDSEQAFLSRAYVRSLGQLDFPAFEGFLRGFLDLVFFKQGQFFVVDYKSNYLGGRYVDYERSRLQLAMDSQHYLLQGLLYAVATHRYARSRLPSYRYEEHFGGISYLFLRGVPPEDPSRGQGVYFFRPSEALIVDLSLALGREEAS